MYVWMDGWLDGWMDGWMDGWRDGWVDRMDGWMDGWFLSCEVSVQVESIAVESGTDSAIIFTTLSIHCN